jgi:hypothetical protein
MSQGEWRHALFRESKATQLYGMLCGSSAVDNSTNCRFFQLEALKAYVMLCARQELK